MVAGDVGTVPANRARMSQSVAPRRWCSVRAGHPPAQLYAVCSEARECSPATQAQQDHNGSYKTPIRES
jgi:hypothetical protein